MFSPLEQFKVNFLFTFFDNVSFNIVYWLIILIVSFGGVLVIFPLKYSFVVEWPIMIFNQKIYNFLINFFKTGKTLFITKFFPLVATVFCFVLFSNVLGLLPYGFTLTSQIFVTFMCSISLFIGITLIGFWVNKANFIFFFVPAANVNFYLKIFLVFIEVLSYIIRPLSLGIRLFANMLAGHTLVFILSTFTYSLILKFISFSLILPFLCIFLIMILEFCIAIIQTYVFMMLTIIYINDVLIIKH